MAFSESTSVKQTGFNVAGDMLMALATAGLLESKEEAKQILAETADTVATAILSDTNGAAKVEPRKYVKSGATKGNATASPADTVFNFGAVKGLTVAEVAGMDEEELNAHGRDLVNEGWQGSPYTKGGAAYLDYVANSKDKKLSYMSRIVNEYLDSVRA
jgi:hypothetical protein